MLVLVFAVLLPLLVKVVVVVVARRWGAKYLQSKVWHTISEVAETAPDCFKLSILKQNFNVFELLSPRTLILAISTLYLQNISFDCNIARSRWQQKDKFKYY